MPHISEQDDPKPSYYTVTPAPVRYDQRLTDFAIKLYGEIVCKTHAEGYCWASNKHFAKLFNKSTSTISNAISKLHQCGHVVCKTVITDDNRQQRLIFLPQHSQSPNEYTDSNSKRSQGALRKCEEGVGKNSDHNIKSNNINKYNTTKQEKRDIEQREVKPIVSSIEDRFNIFYEAYPMKKAKDDAKKAFCKTMVGKNEEDVEDITSKILIALKNQAIERKLRIKHGLWVAEIKYPATWLNKGCWDDEVCVNEKIIVNERSKNRSGNNDGLGYILEKCKQHDSGTETNGMADDDIPVSSDDV